MKNSTSGVKKFTLKRELYMAAICISAAFMFCLFSPAEVYLGNTGDFIIDGAHILMPLLITAAAAAAALWLIVNLMLLINEKLAKLVCCLILGFQSASLVQLLFLNGEMKEIDDAVINYEEPTLLHMADYIVFLGLVFAPLLILALKEKKPGFGKKLFTGKTGTFVSLAIFAMQAAGAGSLLAQNGLGKSQEDSMPIFFSYKDVLDFSKDDDNILVVLTDKLDSNWMNEELKLYPDLYDLLEGFTYYDDNISVYSRTFPSVASMLTGKDYDRRPNEYLNWAWSGETVCSKLKDAGWTVDLVLDQEQSYQAIEPVLDDCDNIRRASSGDYNYVYFADDGIIPTMLDLSMAKLMPYMLKGIFIDGHTSGVSNGFISVKGINHVHTGKVGMESDLRLYRYITSEGITANGSGKVFNFIHTCFAHGCNGDLTKEVYGTFDDEDFPLNLRADFEMLNEIFSRMKELGVYDNTTIILVADHGNNPTRCKTETGDYIEAPIPASLMIKPAGAQRAPLVVDSENKLSNAYFAASILEYAGLDHSGQGYSYNDVIAMDKQPDRYYTVLPTVDPHESYDYIVYRIDGNAYDFKNWHIHEHNGEVVE